MDIKALLNNPTPPTAPPAGATRSNPPPPAARVGKDRVQRPCVKCNTKNHIRSTHCSQCQNLLRPQASSTSKTSGGSRAAPPSTVISKSSAGMPAVVPHGATAPNAGIGAGGATSGGHYAPMTTSRHSTSSSRGGYSNGSKHAYSQHAGMPLAPLGRISETQKKRAQAPGVASGPPYQLSQTSTGAHGADRSASENAQRVRRSCQTCGLSNHIRTGACKGCGNRFENQGRQRTQKR